MPIQSPRTMQYMGPPPDEQQAFEAAVADKAQQAFYRKFPELIHHVVHFKLIEADHAQQRAIGAIVVKLENNLLIFPAIYSSGIIKPMVLFYAPEFKRFFPATKEWIAEITQRSIVNLGNAVEIPKTLEPDQDIRSLVVPPTVGRYAYASAQSTLIQFLTRASNMVKKAFATLLKRNKRVLKYAFENYNKDELLTALRPHTEKTAAVPSYTVSVLTPENSAEEFQREYGNEAAKAWEIATGLGYVVKDTRPETNTYLTIEEPLYFTAIRTPGFYKVFINGEQKEALVVFPRVNQLPTTNRTGAQRLRDTYATVKELPTNISQQWLIFTEDGEIYQGFSDEKQNLPIGEVLHHVDENSNVFKKIKANLAKAPVVGDTGFFVHFLPQGIHASHIVSPTKITLKKDFRIIETDTQSPILVPLTRNGHKEMRILANGLTIIPNSYVFLKGRIVDTCNAVATVRSRTKLANLQQGLAAFLPHAKLLYGHGVFGFAGSNKQFTKAACISYLANKFGLFAPDAAELVEKVEKTGSQLFYIVPRQALSKVASFVKRAQGAMIQTALPPGMVQNAPMLFPSPEMVPAGTLPVGTIPPGMILPGMAPPGMMLPGMPPAEMSPNTLPAAPSPLELAAQEIEQQLLAEARQTDAELARKREELERQLQIIETIKQRAQEIATGQPATPEEAAQNAEPILEQAADLGDQELFEATAIGTLAGLQKPFSLVQEYLPNIEQAIDTLARILLTFWLKEVDVKKDVGDLRYDEFEQKCISLLQNLGELLLQLNRLLVLG